VIIRGQRYSAKEIAKDTTVKLKKVRIVSLGIWIHCPDPEKKMNVSYITQIIATEGKTFFLY